MNDGSEVNSVLKGSNAIRHFEMNSKGTFFARRLVKGLAILLKFLIKR